MISAGFFVLVPLHVDIFYEYEETEGGIRRYTSDRSVFLGCYRFVNRSSYVILFTEMQEGGESFLSDMARWLVLPVEQGCRHPWGSGESRSLLRSGVSYYCTVGTLFWLCAGGMRAYYQPRDMQLLIASARAWASLWTLPEKTRYAGKEPVFFNRNWAL